MLWRMCEAMLYSLQSAQTPGLLMLQTVRERGRIPTKTRLKNSFRGELHTGLGKKVKWFWANSLPMEPPETCKRRCVNNPQWADFWQTYRSLHIFYLWGSVNYFNTVITLVFTQVIEPFYESLTNKFKPVRKVWDDSVSNKISRHNGLSWCFIFSFKTDEREREEKGLVRAL